MYLLHNLSLIREKQIRYLSGTELRDIKVIPSLHLTSTLFSHKTFFFCLFSLGDPPIKIHECMSKIGSFAIPKPKAWFSNGKAAKKILM